MLADVTAVDYLPREPRFEVIYLLASLGVGGFGDTPKRLRVKVRVPGDGARVPTRGRASGRRPTGPSARCTTCSACTSTSHPDLRRVLMPEDWEGFPLRKDYPVQIKQPVKTYEPLQVSAEEFVANIEANRERARKRLMDARAAAGVVAALLDDTIALHAQVRAMDLGAGRPRRPTAIRGAFAAGGKLLVFGNGGSAADAQHLAAELVGRFERERAALPAIALTTDTSVLTSVANDYGFERVFARQVEALGRAGRRRVRRSRRAARRRTCSPALRGGAARGLVTIALTGRDGGAIGRRGRHSRERAGRSPRRACRKCTRRCFT